MLPRSTANLLIGPYVFDMSHRIETLFVSLFKKFLAALIIASAPSLTLKSHLLFRHQCNDVVSVLVNCDYQFQVSLQVCDRSQF